MDWQGWVSVEGLLRRQNIMNLEYQNSIENDRNYLYWSVLDNIYWKIMKTKNKSQEFSFEQFCLKMYYLWLNHYSIGFLKSINYVILAEMPGVARRIKKNRFWKNNLIKKIKFFSLCQPQGTQGSLTKCQPIWSSQLASYS